MMVIKKEKKNKKHYLWQAASFIDAETLRFQVVQNVVHYHWNIHQAWMMVVLVNYMLH
jgi:hypothetical protein